MFTGIVQCLGQVREAALDQGGARLVIAAGALDLDDVALGDSIAVNGVCLTATALLAGAFKVDVSPETLACTVGFTCGDTVNLEKSLRFCDRLGGHLLSGHVDGVGEVAAFEQVGQNRLLAVRIPAEFDRYVARKGSIAVNGVSLTVNAVEGEIARINLIPHTLAQTNLAALRPGARVNIEVDLLARYVERLLGSANPVQMSERRR
jgi:riboflavin synthase